MTFLGLYQYKGGVDTYIALWIGFASVHLRLEFVASLTSYKCTTEDLFAFIEVIS